MQKLEARIAANRIRTPDGTIVQSCHRHNFVSHVDAVNGKVYCVDGGLDYLRRMCDGPYKEESLYEDDEHHLLREAVKWGTRGPKGDQETRFISISEMSLDHIEACLETQHFMNPVIRGVMINEIRYRNPT